MKFSLLVPLGLVLLATMVPGPRAYSQSQNEMTQSAAKDFERADAELNTVYKKALAGQDAEGKTKLTKAQRAWVAFRDAQATFESDDNRGGSLEPMEYYATPARLTKERVKTLRELVSSAAPSKN